MNFTKTLLISAALLSGTLPTYADNNMPVFTLTSSDIAEGQQLSQEQVFNGFGCGGGDKSPALAWKNAPKGTKSFAISAYDPDAPTGSGWWHWSAFNIPVDASSLDAGAMAGKGLPESVVQLSNDYGSLGFGGACPPEGEVHRYKFTIYAMPEKLELDASASNALVGFMINANYIASSSITAVYNR